MNLKYHINEEGNSIFSFSASIIIHAAIFLFMALILNLNLVRSKINPAYVQVITQEYDNNNISPIKTLVKDSKENITNKGSEEKLTSFEQTEFKSTISTFSELNADTTDLDQVYKESTLNVTIKYPVGWTFLDQDIKHKLDGVTFWSAVGNYNPPPYIHLEVKDKELFSPGRYRYKIKMGDYDLYYNEPEVMENQYTQTIYIRTESDEDFSLKLIMVGEDAFKSFQPIFFGMIKTFKFGNSFF